jgi:hypothetical protein
MEHCTAHTGGSLHSIQHRDVNTKAKNYLQASKMPLVVVLAVHRTRDLKITCPGVVGGRSAWLHRLFPSLSGEAHAMFMKVNEHGIHPVTRFATKVMIALDSYGVLVKETWASDRFNVLPLKKQLIRVVIVTVIRQCLIIVHVYGTLRGWRS